MKKGSDKSTVKKRCKIFDSKGRLITSRGPNVARPWKGTALYALPGMGPKDMYRALVNE